MPGLLVIMGSGETAPTMVKPHRSIFDRVGGRPAVLLDTPYGFQSNADDISARAVGYFAASVGREVGVVSWRTMPPPGIERERALAALRGAGWIFAGPGSPTFALRQWRDTPVHAAMAEVLDHDGVVVLASAAALTLGSHTVPVYEIYKAGIDPHWVPGLDLVGRVCGLPAVVIPHFDNAEGGHHDTRFCYLGEGRLALMERELPESSFVLGVDEHTAVLLDVSAGTASVVGHGGMTIRRRGHSAVYPAGSVVDFAGIAACAEELATGTGTGRRTGGGPGPGSAAGPEGNGGPGGNGGPDGGGGGADARSGATAADPGAGDPGAGGAVGAAGIAAAGRVGAAGGVGAAAGSAPPTTKPPTSLHQATAQIVAHFDEGLGSRQVDTCVEAILDLEQTLLDWSADTLTSDEGDRARADLRAMVVRLGELAEMGARDPREAVAPLVEALIELRRRARAARDFSTSDWVRERLAEAAIEVRDTPDGPEWHLTAAHPSLSAHPSPSG